MGTEEIVVLQANHCYVNGLQMILEELGISSIALISLFRRGKAVEEDFLWGG